MIELLIVINNELNELNERKDGCIKSRWDEVQIHRKTSEFQHKSWSSALFNRFERECCYFYGINCALDQRLVTETLSLAPKTWNRYANEDAKQPDCRASHQCLVLPFKPIAFSWSMFIDMSIFFFFSKWFNLKNIIKFN